MSDLVINVRQIGNYPALASSDGTEAVLVQQGGLGGAYAAIETAALVSSALANGGNLGVGRQVPPGVSSGNIFGQLIQPAGVSILWNAFYGPAGETYWTSGAAGAHWFDTNAGFTFGYGPPGQAGQAVPDWVTLFQVNPAGAAQLPFGTLTVARDPAAASEVATMGWVGRSTVASFNGRNGVVRFSSADIYGALCLDSPIASQAWVQQAITTGLQSLLTTCPFVNRWNNRTGSVWLMLSDISCVFFQPGQQPITQTPPVGSDDYSIANTAWVTNYVTNEFAGAGSLATQAWVLANTVSSFNGRQGAVTLSTTDITSAGGAPLNNPQLGGTPTAPTQPVGNASSAIATTAFVWNAVQESTTGVVSWNGRTGVITLDGTDINDAGGALLNSPAFYGVPSAPTAPTGTATTQLATCAFVLNEVQAVGAGVLTFNTRSGNVVLELADITAAGGAPVASPAFSGTPTVPTPASPVAATTTVPNTNWVVQYIALSTVASFNGRIGGVTLNANDISAAGGLANPNVALTGTPTAPTALPGTNTTQVATTAYVTAAITNLGGNYVPLAGNALISGPLTMNGASATLTLNGNATASMQAVPLQQLTSAIAAASFLPLSGGTLTGPLGVQPTLAGSQPAALSVGGQGINYAALGSVGQNIAFAFSAGSPYMYVNGTAYGPLLTLNVGNNTYLQLTGGTLVGNLNGTAASFSGIVNFGTANFPNFFAGPISGNASLSFAAGHFMSLTPSGITITTAANVAVVPSATGGLTVGAAGLLTVFDNGTIRALGYAVGYYDAWQIADGERIWVSGAQGSIMTLDAAGNLTIQGTATKPGGGAWTASSDARIKTVRGAYPKGLAAIMQLQTKEFVYLGNDTSKAPASGEAAPYPESIHASMAKAGTVCAGLIADDVMAVFPECVTETTGYINGTAASDMKLLDITVLFYALINAVIELGQRVQEMDGKAAT